MQVTGDDIIALASITAQSVVMVHGIGHIIKVGIKVTNMGLSVITIVPVINKVRKELFSYTDDKKLAEKIF